MNDDVNKLTGEEICTHLDDQGILKFDSHIWIPNVIELKNTILHEAHNSKFSIHPGSTKIYQDLKKKNLVARYEERYCGLGEQMFYVSESQSRTPKITWINTTFGNSGIKMGEHRHGLCSGITEDQSQS